MISFRNSLKISLLKIPDAHTTSKRICRGHNVPSMEMQKSVMFIKKSYKINILKIKNIIKLEIFVIIQANTVMHIVYVI